jgi:RNHCP domain
MKMRNLLAHARQERNTFGDFVCTNCRNFVSSEVLLSGVHHRNHCPYCLSSRHLDLFKAGDRLSACKARMRPVALTLKRTYKKYPAENWGEIMVVHQCEGCGKISINRIAADDNAEILMNVFENSCGRKVIEKTMLEQNNIDLLTPNDLRILQIQLLGRC